MNKTAASKASAQTAPNKFNKEVTNWDILPCEGIYKLSKNEAITYSHCSAPYWQCPNKNCIMNLV